MTKKLCVVCGSTNAIEQTKRLNGLPTGLFACDSCRQAVKAHQVGVVVRTNGEIHVTDGRARSRLGQRPTARKPSRRRPISILWCSNQRRRRGNGWAFPPNVDRHLRKLTAGKRVCHLFGGQARFGTRIDIDRSLRPDVIADAWLPPFKENAFDVVILDPPYVSINQQMKQQLLRAASYIARERVIWFHTMWIASGCGDHLQLDRSWLVRVGDSCAVRCLQVFRVPAGKKSRPRPFFTRGPAIKYNRWLAGQTRLPFELAKASA